MLLAEDVSSAVIFVLAAPPRMEVWGHIFCSSYFKFCIQVNEVIIRPTAQIV